MTEKQFKALMELIETIVAEKIADAFGRDSGHEYMSRSFAEDVARTALIVSEDD